MNIIDIIDKKRLKGELTREEIGFAVNEYVKGNVKDYQMSSLLMAILINGMNDREVIDLTDMMLHSGDVLDLSAIDGIIVDKHSTGGVGDKVTLVLGPLLASLGIKIAKMSGRGLGFTGGTIDKLESIEGFNTHIDQDKFIKQVNKINIALVSQTGNLVPADKKIYALRDVTGTVESIPLIASSIMSKKIASGADIIMIDVKVGSGALMKTVDDARKLASLMVKIGKAYRKPTICLITNMDIPLGDNIGNSLEVMEVIDVLKNNKKGELYNLCVELSSYMVSLGLNISYEEAKNMVITNLENGNAYNKFIEFVNYQKGDINNLPKPKFKCEIKSHKSGYLTKLDALKLGKISVMTGAGRMSKDDVIDYSSGIVINKNINDYIEAGDTIYTIYSNKKLEEMDTLCYEISDNNEEIINSLKNHSYKMICLNDSIKINNFDKVKSELTEVFEELLNSKSKFEK